MKQFLASCLAILCAEASIYATDIDWSKIRYWAGEGNNKAAVIVQFPDDDRAYVWGYRWDNSSDPTGEDMIRAIAKASDDLDVLIQFTGSLGYTVDGIGYSKDHAILNHLYYDYAEASADTKISFGFIIPNTGMGQTSAPGAAAAQLCSDAISEAGESHIIEHPLNAKAYGYPAYDYDHWISSMPSDDEMRWEAGWYEGFWSYWIGSADISSLGWSGLGLSSVILKDGDVHGWKYKLIGDYDDTEWGTPDYDHFYDDINSGVTSAPTSADLHNAEIYTLSGIRIMRYIDSLPHGIYIIKTGTETFKIAL